MSLETQVMNELKEAMKAKDQAAMRALRAIKAEILLFKTSGSGKELGTADEIKMLQKMIKQRKDSLDVYEKENRGDLAQIEKDEIEVISRFLPEQMSEDELRKFVTALVEELGASGMKDMGRVMGEATKRLSGKAEGKAVADMVKSILS